jgi:hypothetical protein
LTLFLAELFPQIPTYLNTLSLRVSTVDDGLLGETAMMLATHHLAPQKVLPEQCVTADERNLVESHNPPSAV